MRALHLALLAPLLLAATGCSRETPPTPAGVAPTYAAVARGRIDVEGGLLKLGISREGTLSAVEVREGDHVAKGQVLATLDAEPARLKLEAAEAAVAQAKARRELLASKMKAAKVQAERLAEAAAAGAGDGQSADDATAAVQELLAERVGADAAVAMATQQRDAARYELGQRTLHAPIAAQVIRVAAQIGATVSPASGALFILLPLSPPIVRAELSESYVDAVKVGMAATVSTDGSGAEHSWPAHVLRIGRVVGPSSLEDDPQQQANLRTTSCVLAFDGLPPDDARVGQRVLVRFGTPSNPAKAH